MAQELVDHRRVICSLTFVLKLWLDHVDARRKSFQVYVNLRFQDLSSIMTLSTLPWHSMVAARCQGLITLAQRRQLGCVFNPSSPEDLFLPFPRTWAKHVRTRSAWRLHIVDVRPSPADSWLHDICSDSFSLLHAAQV